MWLTMGKALQKAYSSTRWRNPRHGSLGALPPKLCVDKLKVKWNMRNIWWQNLKQSGLQTHQKVKKFCSEIFCCDQTWETSHRESKWNYTCGITKNGRAPRGQRNVGFWDCQARTEGSVLSRAANRRNRGKRAVCRKRLGSVDQSIRPAIVQQRHHKRWGFTGDKEGGGLQNRRHKSRREN